MNSAVPSAEHDADSGAYRAALRSAKIGARLSLSSEQHARLSSQIDAALLELFATLAPACVAFCSPIRGEYDATAVVRRLLDLGWRAAMPVVERPAAPMVFRAWTPESPMSSDRHGIPVPGAGAELRPDVLLLPLVAFDAAGYRLGYGGGYFDRTLAAMEPRPLAVGAGFELARVDDIRPQPHDRRLDVIVTEAGVSRPAD